MYVDMARIPKNVTPYDIAMAQLNVNGYKVNPPAIEEVLKHKLLLFKNYLIS